MTFPLVSELEAKNYRDPELAMANSIVKAGLEQRLTVPGQAKALSQYEAMFYLVKKTFAEGYEGSEGPFLPI